MDKQAIRDRVWDDLEASGTARFPFPPHGRIPNFDGAPEAAERATTIDAWTEATAVKMNPDSPQRPLRRLALESGKTVYMAVPRLRDEACFLELDPDRIDDPADAATLSGSEEYGVPVTPEELPPIDLIVSGSVAVTETGARIGKGEGYSDLEFALLREYGHVDDDTTVLTTVHERQIVDDAVETEAHDVSMDAVVTPDRLVWTGATGKPDGLDWDVLDEETIEEIPILQRLRP